MDVADVLVTCLVMDAILRKAKARGGELPNLPMVFDSLPILSLSLCLSLPSSFSLFLSSPLSPYQYKSTNTDTPLALSLSHSFVPASFPLPLHCG
jgi:hypothetical protein